MSGSIALLILNVSARGGECSTQGLGHFTPRKEPQYQLNRGLGGLHGLSGRVRRGENLLYPPVYRSFTAKWGIGKSWTSSLLRDCNTVQFSLTFRRRIKSRLHLLVLLGGYHILHVFRIRVKLRLFRKSKKI